MGPLPVGVSLTETPPRTWGRHTSKQRLAESRRNTPTHVGKTGIKPLREHSHGKHPHARGEDTESQTEALLKMETPPRTWGRRKRRGRERPRPRNTPTHVGKTVSRADTVAFPGKHPHARGEDTMNNNSLPDLIETPPRTWGRRRLVHRGQLLLRNTPTHVGKTSWTASPMPLKKKHPHARGEDHFPDDSSTPQ